MAALKSSRSPALALGNLRGYRTLTVLACAHPVSDATYLMAGNSRHPRGEIGPQSYRLCALSNFIHSALFLSTPCMCLLSALNAISPLATFFTWL